MATTTRDQRALTAASVAAVGRSEWAGWPAGIELLRKTFNLMSSDRML